MTATYSWIAYQFESNGKLTPWPHFFISLNSITVIGNGLVLFNFICLRFFSSLQVALVYQDLPQWLEEQD